jgi:hypothetical protein
LWNRGASAADAVFGFAAVADGMVADGDFKRRESGSYEIELSDGADEFAEGGVLEKAINDEDGGEISESKSSSPPRRRPKVEKFVGEKYGDEESDGEPLVAQGFGPVEAGAEETASGVTHEHEGTDEAEKIPGAEENQDQRSAKVNPR